VDAEDAFDPFSAAAAGVELPRLLWIRCGHNAAHALRAADLLLEGGGFGVVGAGSGRYSCARRAPHLAHFLVRLRRAVEHTPTVLIAVERQSNAKNLPPSLMLELSREQARWSGRHARFRAPCSAACAWRWRGANRGWPSPPFFESGERMLADMNTDKHGYEDKSLSVSSVFILWLEMNSPCF